VAVLTSGAETWTRVEADISRPTGADIVACRTVSRQRLGKQFPAATNRRARIEVLLETAFSTGFVQLGNEVSSVRSLKEE
jgi:hypothetical protein